VGVFFAYDFAFNIVKFEQQPFHLEDDFEHDYIL
jgi:hypothetical protein